MKTKSILKIFWLFLFVAIASISQAQQNKCGPYVIDQSAMDKALKFERQQATSGEKMEPGVSSTVIRVYFRICEPTQGVLIDITEAQVTADFNNLVSAYSPDNICFVNCGLDRIYNTQLDTFNFSLNSPTIFYPYGIQNCITVFYVTKLGGKNSSSGGGASGVTFGIPNAWTIVQKSYIGQGVLEHEVGHCLGLLHTFDFVHGNGLEDINGANGATSADLISDTPADPYARANEDTVGHCFSTSNNGCTYAGTCTDPNGQSNYSPPYTDLMSYWCQAFYPTYTITSGQYTRINSFLNTAAVLQITESPSTLTVGPNVNTTSGYLMNSAVTTLTTSGSVQISASAISTFGGQTVLLEPGFHATPSTGGYFYARPVSCTPNAYRSVWVDFPNSNGSSEENEQAGLLEYPNPTSSDVNIAITLKEDETHAVLEIFDTNLKLMRETNFDGLHSGTQTEQVSMQDLPSGVYYLVLKSTSSSLTTKLVVLK